MDGLIDKLKGWDNVLISRGAQIVPDPIYQTHMTLRGDKDHYGIWWYHAPSRKLLYSREAGCHLDNEFRKEITDLSLLTHKRRASEKGWISGRIGNYKEKFFVFIYAGDIVSGALSGPIAADLILQLSEASGLAIAHFIDEKGFDLVH